MDEWDAYFWPDSTVLQNKRGLTNEAALRAFEYEATRQRSEQLAQAPIEGTFDAAHFRAIHCFLFQDVYEWAGQYRTVEFSKGSSQFAPLKTPAHTLESWGERILADLAAENHLKGLQKPGFVERLTHHYGELNFWHPMREGNGRATKEFLAQLAKEAGYRLELQRVSDKAWNSAAEHQMARDDPRLSQAIFEKIAIPSRAMAFRDEPISDAVKQFPELKGAAEVLEVAQRKAAADYDTGTQRVFIAGVHAKLLERLSTGEIVNARSADRLAKEDPLDYTR
ncbi:MAG: Fic family protein [Caldimonas sp.]